MKVDKTPGQLIAEIKMERAASFAGALLVIESLDDKKFWLPFVDGSHCRILMAGGKQTIITAMTQLNTSGEDPSVLGIVDCDFDDILGMAVAMDNLVYLDAHDVEAVLVRSSAFERVVQELAESEAIRRVERAYGMSLKEKVTREALRTGKLRCVAIRDNWGVSFADFSCFATSDAATGTLVEAKVIGFVIAQANLNPAVIAAEMNAPAVSDTWHLCHGKDLLTMMCINLQNLLKVRGISVESLFRMLRLAFTVGDLRSTRMYASLMQWQAITHQIVLAR